MIIEEVLIIYKSSCYELSEEINRLIALNYQPSGDVFIFGQYNTRLGQKMVKYSPTQPLLKLQGN